MLSYFKDNYTLYYTRNSDTDQHEVYMFENDILVMVAVRTSAVKRQEDFEAIIKEYQNNHPAMTQAKIEKAIKTKITKDNYYKTRKKKLLWKKSKKENTGKQCPKSAMRTSKTNSSKQD